MTQVFLRRDIVDRGEQPQRGPAHGEEGHDCKCHGVPGHECRYEVKYEKVMGELDELRAEFSPIVLNRGKKDEGGKSREVTVLMSRDLGPKWFDTPLRRWRDMPVDEALARGLLVVQADGLQAAHFVTGELVELPVAAGGSQ